MVVPSRAAACSMLPGMDLQVLAGFATRATFGSYVVLADAGLTPTRAEPARTTPAVMARGFRMLSLLGDVDGQELSRRAGAAGTRPARSRWGARGPGAGTARPESRADRAAAARSA